MKNITIIILLLSFCLKGFSQEKSLADEVVKAKFQIIKATIEFISTDKDAYPKLKDLNLKKTNRYDSLKKIVGRNNMGNLVLNYIDKWEQIKLDTNAISFKESLYSFKENIVTDITKSDGKTDRARRRSLPNYNAYLSELNSIVDKITPPQNEMRTEELPQSIGDTTKPDIPKKDASKNNHQGIDSEVVSNNKPILQIACIILFILLGVVTFFYIKVKKENRHLFVRRNHYKETSEILNETIAKDAGTRNSTIYKLETELTESNKTIAKLKDELYKLKINQSPIAQTSSYQEPQTNIPNTHRPPPNPATIKFAIYADQGDGFSQNELHENESNDTIFEIRIKSQIFAEYRISNNLLAQKSALTDPSYFLSKTCIFDGSPSKNSSIKTDVPGELKLQGNKWLITSPAKISFT